MYKCITRKKNQRSRNGIKHVLRISYLASIRNWITSNWPRQRFLILKYQRSCYIGIDLISTDPGKSSSYIGCHKERSGNRTGRWCIGSDIRQKHKAARFLQSQKESEYPQRSRQGWLRHHPPSPSNMKIYLILALALVKKRYKTTQPSPKCFCLDKAGPLLVRRGRALHVRGKEPTHAPTGPSISRQRCSRTQSSFG